MPRPKKQIFDVKETKKKIDLPPLTKQESIKIREIRSLLFDIFERLKIRERKKLPELTPGQYRTVRAALDIYTQVSKELHDSAGRIEISIKEASIEDLKAAHRFQRAQEIQGDDIQVLEEEEGGREGVAPSENGASDRVLSIGHQANGGA